MIDYWLLAAFGVIYIIIAYLFSVIYIIIAYLFGFENMIKHFEDEARERKEKEGTQNDCKR